MSEQAGRYQRSAGGMVGAMVVLVVLLVAWVAIQSLVKDQPDSAVRTVDYAQVVAPAREAAKFDLVAPASLPKGWRATSVTFRDTLPQHWHLGVLTDDDRYVGLEQELNGIRPRRAGVRAAEVVASGERLLLRLGEPAAIENCWYSA